MWGFLLNGPGSDIICKRTGTRFDGLGEGPTDMVKRKGGRYYSRGRGCVGVTVVVKS